MGTPRRTDLLSPYLHGLWLGTVSHVLYGSYEEMCTWRQLVVLHVKIEIVTLN